MEATAAASLAIAIAKRRGLNEVTADELLLGCFETLARFGIVRFGNWTFDLAEFGLDWMAPPDSGRAKVAYSQGVVALMDLAARIARIDGMARVEISHLLAAFASEETGLTAGLKRRHEIGNAQWRAAAAAIAPAQETATAPLSRGNDYLTPEQAAEALGLHVQTMRGYVRTGRVPAFRIAGERALRIRRDDLEKVLEPLTPES